MKAKEQQIALKQHILKYVKYKYENETSPNWSFGHDWNSNFPRNTDIPVFIRDTVYTALDFMFKEYKQDLYLSGFIKFLEDENLNYPNGANKIIKKVGWIIYYQLKGLEYIEKNLN